MSRPELEEVETAIEEFRSLVARRERDFPGTVKGVTMAELRGARDRILDAVQALPSRRERIAIAAMQGLLAGDTARMLSSQRTAAEAIDQADALIKALDEGTTPGEERKAP